jgi:site-specific DNA recombinase
VLLKAIAQAHIWFEDLKAGKSYKNIAAQYKIDQRHVARTIKLAFLAPDIIEAIFQGCEPQGLTAERLLRLPDLPIDWQEQQKLLEFI